MYFYASLWKKKKRSIKKKRKNKKRIHWEKTKINEIQYNKVFYHWKEDKFPWSFYFWLSHPIVNFKIDYLKSQCIFSHFINTIKIVKLSIFWSMIVCEFVLNIAYHFECLSVFQLHEWNPWSYIQLDKFTHEDMELRLLHC